MNDALYFLRSMKDMIWDGLDSCNVPIFGVSFLVFLLSVFFIKLCLWFYCVVTGAKVNEKRGGRYDNNNNYIYRRSQ